MKKEYKSLIKSLITLLCSTVPLVLIMLIVLKSAFGWFVSNKAVAGSGVVLEVSESGNTLLGIECFPVTDIINNNYYYIDPPDDYNYELPCEDPANIVESKFKKAIVIHLSYSVTENTSSFIDVKTNTDWIDNISMSANEFVGENYISNCIQITTGTVNGYTFTATGTPVSFVSGTPDSAEVNKASQITIEESLDRGNGEVFLVLEYNRALIEYYNNCDPLIYNKINFENDLIFGMRTT